MPAPSININNTATSSISHYSQHTSRSCSPKTQRCPDWGIQEEIKYILCFLRKGANSSAPPPCCRRGKKKTYIVGTLRAGERCRGGAWEQPGSALCESGPSARGASMEGFGSGVQDKTTPSPPGGGKTLDSQSITPPPHCCWAGGGCYREAAHSSGSRAAGRYIGVPAFTSPPHTPPTRALGPQSCL